MGKPKVKGPDFVWSRCTLCGLWVDEGPWRIEAASAAHFKRCFLSQPETKEER